MEARWQVGYLQVDLIVVLYIIIIEDYDAFDNPPW
jgi:hypothetical protein